MRLQQQLVRIVLLAISTVPISVAAVSSGFLPVYGIYSLNGSKGTINSQILSNRYIDGIVLRYAWNSLEPSDGVFNWATVDSQIAQVKAYGKKVSIGVLPGFESPSWLYQEHAQKFNFIWDKNRDVPICSVQTIPVPWDPVFVSKWKTFIQALGQRYNSNPTVANVKITGINSESEEHTLPLSVNAPINGGQCTSYNDVANWIKIGYTRTKVEDAWQQFAQTFHLFFPAKSITAQLAPGAFPPIDQNGRLMAGKADQQLTLDLLNRGIADYPSQFAGQNNGLSASWIWSDLIKVSSQIVTGYQTVSPMGSNLQRTLNLAVQGGAEFVELYPVDVLAPAEQPVLAWAHGQLQ